MAGPKVANEEGFWSFLGVFWRGLCGLQVQGAVASTAHVRDLAGCGFMQLRDFVAAGAFSRSNLFWLKHPSLPGPQLRGTGATRPLASPSCRQPIQKLVDGSGLVSMRHVRRHQLKSMASIITERRRLSENVICWP